MPRVKDSRGRLEQSVATAKPSSDSCSLLALAANEPLAGTATEAKAWIAIEQSGPYGRDALTQSRFPVDVGRELSERAGQIGAKVVLIRRIGKHVDSIAAQSKRCFWVADGRSMVRAEVEDPAELLAINFDKLLDGSLTDAVPHSVPDSDPMLLVCTHSKRDVCCALKGRPVAIDLSERFGCEDSRIWEVSHLGGHRMAPTAVQLPQGYLHGRLDNVSAAEVWEESCAGRLVLETCRGRSNLAPAAQVAELAVREHAQLLRLESLTVTQDLSTSDRTRDAGLELETWVVANPGTGDSWEVEVVREELGPRPESCGKDPVIGFTYRAISTRLRD